MATTSGLRIFYLSYLSAPSADRLIYRAILRSKARRILEVGIAGGRRATRMIEVAKRLHPPSDIYFTGTDPFESRGPADGPGLSLKKAHRVLSATGVRTRLIPGDPFSALAVTANTLRPFDLVVISGHVDPVSLAKTWFYFPRMLHETTQIFRERILPGGRTEVARVDLEEVDALAKAAGRRAA